MNYRQYLVLVYGSLAIAGTLVLVTYVSSTRSWFHGNMFSGIVAPVAIALGLLYVCLSDGNKDHGRRLIGQLQFLLAWVNQYKIRLAILVAVVVVLTVSYKNLVVHSRAVVQLSQAELNTLTVTIDSRNQYGVVVRVHNPERYKLLQLDWHVVARGEDGTLNEYSSPYTEMYFLEDVVSWGQYLGMDRYQNAIYIESVRVVHGIRQQGVLDGLFYL
ncbi:MAG: hypothetical protein IPI29_09340 [Ignavibacteria bacterium]|nr:hypothetical protein [Ignavibacteria bacterium]